MTSPQYEKTIDAPQGSSQYDTGNGLLSTLSLPDGLKASSLFAWQAHLQVDQKNGPVMGPFVPGNNPNRSQLTLMTVAGALDWLRTLAVQQGGKPGGEYDQIVHQLVAAGYLSPSEARYGSWSAPVANKFIQSVVDVWHMNGGEAVGSGAGQLVTWGDHMKAMIDARKAAGQIDPNTEMPIGSGGSGGTGPQRTDRFTNPDDVKASINNEAENILGRKLTDKEAAGFQALYHGLEAKYNDQLWAAQSSTATTTPSVTSAPTVGAEAQNYMQDSPSFDAERTDQLLGSYVGVLRNIAGLGAGGVSHAVG